MSRNSKSRRQIATAKQYTAIRKAGKKGPAQTVKKNKKIKTWWRKTTEERTRAQRKAEENEE